MTDITIAIWGYADEPGYVDAELFIGKMDANAAKAEIEAKIAGFPIVVYRVIEMQMDGVIGKTF